jgi:FkbM family methyltransferase
MVSIGASRSQHGEDELIAQLIPSDCERLFVDVGANDGVSWSNSYNFAEAGFRVLLVEPMPVYAARCALHHCGNPNVFVEPYAISRNLGSATFYVNLDAETDLLAMRSSLQRAIIPSDRVSEVTVPTAPLSFLLDKHRVSERYAVLSIDAEGVDLQVLETADLNRRRPQVICIEEGANVQAIREFLQAKDYRFVTKLGGVNGLFVDDRKAPRRSLLKRGFWRKRDTMGAIAPGERPAPSPSPPSEPPPAPAPAAPQERSDGEYVGFLDMALSGWLNEDVNELAPGFPISGEDVVVDVGSGDGGMATFCARRAETVLIDQDGDRLASTLERLRSEVGDRVRGQTGDAAAVPLPDAFATRVVCTQVLEHVEDPAQVLRELVRIGRPGALYLLSVPAAVSERLQTHLAPPFYFEKPNHIRIFEPDEFARVVEDAGLAIEGRRSHGFFWAMYLTFFWQSGVELAKGSDPVLDAWCRTWAELLRTRDGPRIKAVLDELAPQCDTIVARKPG